MKPLRKDICDCSVLEHAAKESDHPIRWDERMNEYFMTWGKGRMMVYFCPFCGGSISKARRSSEFVQLTEQEEARILDLFRGVLTEGDVISRFGLPDEVRDFATALRRPAQAGRPESGDASRGMVFKRLSPVAEIVFEVGPGDAVRGTWNPKLIGESRR